MKFYKDTINRFYWNKIINNKLTCSYHLTSAHNNISIAIEFYKNGQNHNSKNAAKIYNNGNKYFYLNGKIYNHNNFTKQSWRKFIKLQTFL
jgi:hypothetical protein